MERYVKLFTAEPRLYCNGSPVIIEAGALHKDTILDDIVLQLKFRSVSDADISSLTVDVTCFNAANEVVVAGFTYRYTDISIDNATRFFGQKTLITLPINSIRSVKVRVTEATFSDGRSITPDVGEWETVPEQTRIATFGAAFEYYFKQKYGEKSIALPLEFKDLWLCTCGRENKRDNCSLCGSTRVNLFPFDLESEKKDSVYSVANQHIASARYDMAIKVFGSISGWRDADEKVAFCEEKIKELKAQAEADRLKRMQQAEAAQKDEILSYGNSWMSSENVADLEEAIRHFEAISGWKNADEKADICKRKIEEIKAKKEAERLKAERIAKRDKKIAIITTPIICAVIAFIIVLNTFIIPAQKKKDFIDTYGIELYQQFGLVEKGSYITFGAYEQDNNTANGKEDIEWLVLEVKNGKALVISKYSLNCKQYHSTFNGVTWETCTLRKWLNNYFLDSAFSANEKAAIPTVTVSADKNPDYITNPGNATQDQVFLLSITEANKYFRSDSARQCKPTEYAIAQGANVDNDNGWWWLRSPGNYKVYAAFVDCNGVVGDSGYYITTNYYAVRPAMWIDLSEIE